LAFIWISLVLIVEVNSTHLLLAVIVDCHGGVVFIEECTLKRGSPDPFGVRGSCPPFCEDYISDMGRYHVVVDHMPNVFYFAAVWACCVGILASEPGAC
jgi:hypothetical protein